MKKGEQLSGFNYDASRNETVVLGAGANAINVYYTKAIYVNQPATLTVNHIGVTVAEDGTETNKVLSTETLNGYTEKDVVTSADVRKGDTLSGYDYDSSRDESIVLGVGANTINVYYITEEVDIDDDKTPLVPPDKKDDGKDETDSSSIPSGDGTENGNGEEETDIIDEDVPMTGDANQAWAFALSAVLAMAGVSAVVLKRKQQNEK